MPLMKASNVRIKKSKTAIKKKVTRAKNRKPSNMADVLSAVTVLHGDMPPSNILVMAYFIASKPELKLKQYGKVKIGRYELNYLGSGITCSAYRMSKQWVVKIHHKHDSWEKSIGGIKAALNHIPDAVPSASLVTGCHRTVMVQEFLSNESLEDASVGQLSVKCTQFNLTDIRMGNVGMDARNTLKIMDFGNYSGE